MMEWVKKAKRDLFRMAESRGFVDPITRSAPSSEVSLTSLLAYYMEQIDWAKVPVYDTHGNLFLNENDLFPVTGRSISEYALLCPDNTDISEWGDMRADILHYCKDPETTTIIENKIGAKCTFGSRPENSQLARQLKYLAKFGRGKSSLVVLTLKEMFKQGWYVSELRETVQFHKSYSNIRCGEILWEDVLNNFEKG